MVAKVKKDTAEAREGLPKKTEEPHAAVARPQRKFTIRRIRRKI